MKIAFSMKGDCLLTTGVAVKKMSKDQLLVRVQ